MGLFKRKKQKKFISGGFKRYRNPAVFGSSKKLSDIAQKQPTSNRKFSWPSFSMLKIILSSLVAIILIWFLFFSDHFAIKDVFVEGNKLTAAEEISVYAPKGHNIFFLGIKSTKQRILREHPELKDVVVYKGLPNAVKFVVLEEDPKMVWQTREERYLISSQGKVAEKIRPEEFTDLPNVIDKKGLPVVPGQQLLSPNFIAFISNINQNFYDRAGTKVNHFEVDETTFDVSAYTDAGFFVKLNTMRSSNKQLEDLKTVLASKRADVREYIDLRIDGWGYYK